MYFLLGLLYGLASQHLQLTEFVSRQWASVAAVLIALAAWYISGTALNDYADYEIDKINLKYDKQRPLVQGTISRRQLLYIAVVAMSVVLVFAAATRTLGIFVLFAGLLLLNVSYSLPPMQISRRGGLAPVLLPLGYVFLPVAAGLLLVRHGLTGSVYAIIAALYLHFIARILLKDHRDVKGDAKAGKRTLILQHGNQYVVRLCATAFIASTFLFGALFIRDYRYLLLFVAVMFGGALIALYELHNEERWPYQRPLITLFGRMCSGLITILIIGLLARVTPMSTYQIYATLVLISVIFINSTSSILRLQQPKG